MSTLAPATSPHALAEQAASTAIPTRAPRSLWNNAWRQFRRNKMALTGAAHLLALTVFAIFAPAIAPHNPVDGDLRPAGKFRQAAWMDAKDPKKSGSWDYPLGTDGNGRDDFSRLVFGTRISLVVGFIAMAVILLIGVPIGLAAGFAGAWLDNFLMRVTDVVYAFPTLLFFIIMQVSTRDTGCARSSVGWCYSSSRSRSSIGRDSLAWCGVRRWR